MTASEPPTVTLPYTIAGCSEHSGRYVADNIRIDSPQDQGSRWSGAHQTSEIQQWLLLRLDNLAIISELYSRMCMVQGTDYDEESITFGKVGLSSNTDVTGSLKLVLVL